MRKILMTSVAVITGLTLIGGVWASGIADKYVAVRGYRAESGAFRAIANAGGAWPHLTRIERSKGALLATGSGGRPLSITFDTGLTRDLDLVLGRLGFEAVAKIDQDVYFIRSSGYEFMNGIVLTETGGPPTYEYVSTLERLDNGAYYYVAR